MYRKINDPRGIRMQSIQKMHDMIMKGGEEGISLKTFLSLCSYNMGLTHKTSTSYLQDLINLKLIDVDEENDLIRGLKP